MQLNSSDIVAFRAKILKWYDAHRRVLPWRALPHETPDPYKVWLSEVMLQQTTVQAVIKYFLRFVELWPRVEDLAGASEHDLMQEWAGLGYYARARNLHKCAKIIVKDYAGVFPDSQDELRKLPGIGDYTGAAITAIAFAKPANVVDGNVERVMARYFNEQAPLPGVKPILKQYALMMANGVGDRSGDYAQSLMDLGATICTPKNPLCVLCPLNADCLGYRAGNPSRLPLRLAKPDKPKRAGYVYLIKNEAGDLLVQLRPSKGLLGGMMGLPTSDWASDGQAYEHLKFLADCHIQDERQNIVHVFTHFQLTLHLYSAQLSQASIPDDAAYQWISLQKFESMRFPTVFAKAKKLFMKA